MLMATLVNSGAKDLIESFLAFLNKHMKSESEIVQLLETTNRSNDTLFTLLMKSGLEIEEFANARKALIQLLIHHSDLNLWFPKLVKQLIEPNSCDLNSRSMKELIDLSADFVDFKAILEQKDPDGNNILMELAKNMKDDALREFLTNTYSFHFVSIFLIYMRKFSKESLECVEKVFHSLHSCTEKHFQSRYSFFFLWFLEES